MKPLGLMLATAGLACAQGRPLDWSFFGADNGRTGWEKSDSRITKENAASFQQVLKRKLGSKSVTPPVIIGTLISYKGFKELGFVADSSDTVTSIDVDTNRVFWSKSFRTVPFCSADAVAVPSLTPPLNFGQRSVPGARPAAGILGTGAFGAPRPLFALSADGKLHLLNTSTGDDLVPAVPFIPSGAMATSLSINDGILYTTTLSKCGTESGVWAMDLRNIDPAKPAASVPVSSFKGKSSGDVAFSSARTVYFQTATGLQALDSATLAVTHTFPGINGTVTPLIFANKTKDRIVTAGADGTLYVLDGDTTLSKTPGLGRVAGMASWEEKDGPRYLVAAHNGKITAFTVDDAGSLTKAWAVDSIDSVVSPVTTSGIVFALSKSAVLYALDGMTGKVLYKGGPPGSTAAQTGLTVANGRVYFTTTDGTLYAYGIFLER